MTNNSVSAPPVGGFQELDGRRVFVHRLGSGGPAVVFLPGAGAAGLDYSAVQQGVSRFRTAVVYDRGGSGYSDPVPLPRTAAEVATELHELLLAQDLAAPYILVAHSLGGAYAHRFAQLYPGEVAGMVWVDGFHPDWQDFLAITDQPLRSDLVALADELRAGPELPDVPLIALTAGFTEGMRRMAEAVVSAVSSGEHRVVAGAGHHQLCVTRPDVVVQAIRDVIDRAARP
ncbi:MAG TPA: alpha/beta hydrolase [Pseudonocardiaceae bacterium]|nr:alpha/beta hydrolase [Pseudonocardiaceae bacterium]